MAYASTASTKKELSPEDLLKKLERQDAIGIKGEDFAIEYEKKRLEKLGADPRFFGPGLAGGVDSGVGDHPFDRRTAAQRDCRGATDCFRRPERAHGGQPS